MDKILEDNHDISKAEKIGAALAKAVKAATGITSAKLGAAMYRTNISDVPKVEGLKRDDGWIDMQVQFLIDKKSAGADHVVGWTVLKPGASHECHRHRNCDEFFIVLKGKGHIITDKGLEPSGEGDVVYSPRGCWHGFNNTSSEDVVLVWGWMGAGSIEASGYEVPEGGHSHERDAQRSAHRQRHARAVRAAPARARRRRPRQIGWKVGLGAPAAWRSSSSPRRVVGFLLDRAQLESGATVSLKGWSKPVAETEIAAYIGHDLSAQRRPRHGARGDRARSAPPSSWPTSTAPWTTSRPCSPATSGSATSFSARATARAARHRLEGLRAGSSATARTSRCRPTSKPRIRRDRADVVPRRRRHRGAGRRAARRQFIICGAHHRADVPGAGRNRSSISRSIRSARFRCGFP